MDLIFYPKILEIRENDNDNDDLNFVLKNDILNGTQIE